MRNCVMLCLIVLCIAGLAWNDSPAQLLPENHYLVYEVPEVYLFTGQMELTDQFGVFSTNLVELDKFATPVQKNGEPMFDELIHQTWWRIYDPQSIWWTHIQNQFGAQTWQVKDGRYLVLPAAKIMPDPLQPSNHYKCYDAIGPALNIPVTLVDQFGTYQMIVMEPVQFCNPVEKIIDGVTYQIIDPLPHLACYRLQPPIPYGQSVMAYDQFGDWRVTPMEQCWLCVPSLKLQAVPAERTTWGEIKALYSD